MWDFITCHCTVTEVSMEYSLEHLSHVVEKSSNLEPEECCFFLLMAGIHFVSKVVWVQHEYLNSFKVVISSSFQLA